jgi:hypothetical protein
MADVPRATAGIRRALALLVLLGVATATVAMADTSGSSTGGVRAGSAGPTPSIACDEGSRPEQVQGEVPPGDLAAGTAGDGYYCNARVVSVYGGSGGYRVERYADSSGHVCAYYDTSRILGVDAGSQARYGFGVYAMDMADPAKPVQTATLTTPAMLSPHESLRINEPRGLLVAAMGTPATAPGVVDVYDVRADCRHPRLLSSTALPVLGHEGAFAPDGRTYYVSGDNGRIAAVDLTRPEQPSVVWTGTAHEAHGLSLSLDGRTAYLAENGAYRGLVLLDVSEVQERRPDPQVREISRITWPTASIPQNATPFRSGGRDYVLETDEFGGGDAPVGAARIIDVGTPTRPYVVSDLRLAINDRPGTGYTAHYCTLPSRVDPAIVACSFTTSGLRVFDIRDPRAPREIAFHNLPNDGETATAYAAPAFDPVRKQLWYSDHLHGLIVVRLTGEAARLPYFARRYVQPGN